MKDAELNTDSATKTSLAVPRHPSSLRLPPVERDDPKIPGWAAITAQLGGPAGLGMAATRLAEQLNRAVADKPEPTPSAPVGDLANQTEPTPSAPIHDPAYAYRPWGDGKASPLYCPVPERIDDNLASEVDTRLIAWATDCGLDEQQLAPLRKSRLGRLAMLAHADCDDPDRLLLAAQMNAAWWAADDSYCDDTELGATPTKLPPHLSLVMAAMDPLPPLGEFTPPLQEALRADPILVALRSGVDHMEQYGTPTQVQRVCYSTFAMFVSWTAYAAWRHTAEYPPAWEYIAARQHDSFYTSMTLIDIVSGYELPAALFYDPRVRRAAFQAGTATVIVNDLLSVAKDAADEKPVCNLVLQIVADRGCSIEEATEITVQHHNDLVRDFEANHRNLLAVPSVELQRFMRGLRAWMGGGFEWHNTNPRYKSSSQQ